jgi:restriction system protein
MSGLKRVANRRNDALAQTHWAKVELLLAEHYRRAGYDVEHCGTGATGAKFDGGVDLRLRRTNELIVVQCKHWNAMKVAHNDVHQLLGIMVNESATGAILVTSGEFTKAAIEAATRQGHVQLIDGDDLREMLGPLPEPQAPSQWSALMASELGQSAASVGRYAGWRLLDAAEDRIRGGRGRRGGAVGVALKVALIKAAAGLVFMLFILLVGAMLVPRVINSLQPTPRPAQMPASPSQQAGREQDSLRAGSVITETKLPAERPAYLEQTPEQIRESQRKADEAIKVLEATTPEM